MKIVFLTSSRYAFDDRIFHHQAKSLVSDANNVFIIGSTEERIGTVMGINIEFFDGKTISKRKKVKLFIDKLSDINPDVIIAPEPICVLAGYKYKRRFRKKCTVIYDITEWYPSKKNLSNYTIPARSFHFVKFLLLNLCAGICSDAFLFGEHYKAIPFRKVFKRKPYSYCGYFPDLKVIPFKKSSYIDDCLRLTYSGKISIEKGFVNFIKVVNQLLKSEVINSIELKIIGWFDSKDEMACREHLAALPNNVQIIQAGIQPLEAYLDLISDDSLFLDLRADDWENQRCLPIKLYYYAALGRPVIYSDLKAIRKKVEIEKFGHLVKPSDSVKIANYIAEYVRNGVMYEEHADAARELAVSKYNWATIEPAFISFIRKIAPNE